MQNVIILKSESDNSQNYDKVLKDHNFNPIFIPSLDFDYKNLNSLSEKLLHPEKYSGIIFVSPRCVAAVKNALLNDNINEDWRKLDNYCVGEATYKNADTELNLQCKGKDSGNASNLSDFINFDLKSRTIKYPFLLPCGNLKLNIIETKFLEYGYLLEDIEVYETIAHPDLENNLRENLSNKSIKYLVFFSPSGVNYCCDIINKLKLDLSKIRLVAIGPTTKKCLESWGLNVYSTAEKPTPEHLVLSLNNIN